MSSPHHNCFNVLLLCDHFNTHSYAMEFDDELRNVLGIESRETFEEFYRVLYELARDGDVDRCNEAADEEEDRNE